MSALALLLALAGFTLFALATRDLHQRFLGIRPSGRRQQRMRISAWAMLLLALPPCFAASGAVFGPILWAGIVMLAAALVFLTVNLWPQRAPATSRKRKSR